MGVIKVPQRGRDQCRDLCRDPSRDLSRDHVTWYVTKSRDLTQTCTTGLFNMLLQ